jgi:hypothetical protein
MSPTAAPAGRGSWDPNGDARAGAAGRTSPSIGIWCKVVKSIASPFRIEPRTQPFSMSILRSGGRKGSFPRRRSHRLFAARYCGHLIEEESYFLEVSRCVLSSRSPSPSGRGLGRGRTASRKTPHPRIAADARRTVQPGGCARALSTVLLCQRQYRFPEIAANRFGRFLASL